MVHAPAIDALRTALEPVEALRGEHSQWESWVKESIAALDALHGELADWQRDLARQQAELDQREAEFTERPTPVDAEQDARLAAVQLQLSRSQDECRQLEEENVEQLASLDDLERQLAVAHTEVRLVRKHSEEMTRALETERAGAADERRHGTAELKELRRLMERHGEMLGLLAGHIGAMDDATPVAAQEAGVTAGDVSSATAARAAEFRRRAKSRRDAHRRET